MKFGYAIVLALVALVAVSGFAMADRLPSQVPENQVFTIDTLIDVTGPVSEESEMQWTLDDQNLAYDGANQADQAAADITDAAATALNTLIADGLASATFKNGQITDIWVADLAQGKYVPGTTTTWAQYIASLVDNNDWRSYSGTATGSIHNSMLNPTEEIMILTWTDSLRSNGGKLSLSKNIDFDSKNKGDGLSNLEVEKVLTYASTEGNHLVGAEEWTLDVAGSYEKTADTIRCVFASASSEYFPAFCNVVKAKSELVNINSAQISTKGSARGVAATSDIPAALSYQIAVTPDSNSGSGFADGTVKTLFGGSIMEARGNHLTPSATNNWKDTASVSGGIKNFQKSFSYESGFTI